MGCATSSKGDQPALPATNLYVLGWSELSKRVVPGTLVNGQESFKLVDAKNPQISTSITRKQADARVIQAVSIILAESGGYPGAYCVNDDKSSAPGSKDRGLFQINDKAFPNVSDLAAFTPSYAFQWAYLQTDGWLSWGPWTGSKGLDHSSTFYKAAEAASTNAAGEAVPEIGIGPIAIDDPTGSLLDWAKGLGKLLSYVTSAAFWRRFGMGALGVLLVIIAVALVVAESKAGQLAKVASIA